MFISPNYTFLKALSMFTEKHHDGKLIPINEKQKKFVEMFADLSSELKSFSDEELKGWISQDDNFLNDRLEENEFKRWFKKLSKNEWGLLAILHLILKWSKKPEEDRLYFNDSIMVKAIKFNGGFSVSTSDEKKIVSFDLKNGDKAVVYLNAEKPESDIDVMERIEKLRDKTFENEHYDYVTMPMVEFEYDEKIEWLRGMRLADDGSVVKEAQRMVKFRLDEEGIEIKEAVMMNIMSGCIINPEPPKHLYIDKPFYLWIERDGCSRPIYGLYVNEEVLIEKS